jgi:hypothetical protein
MAQKSLRSTLLRISLQSTCSFFEKWSTNECDERNEGWFIKSEQKGVVGGARFFFLTRADGLTNKYRSEKGFRWR